MHQTVYWHYVEVREEQSHNFVNNCGSRAIATLIICLIVEFLVCS